MAKSCPQNWKVNRQTDKRKPRPSRGAEVKDCRSSPAWGVEHERGAEEQDGHDKCILECQQWHRLWTNLTEDLDSLWSFSSPTRKSLTNRQLEELERNTPATNGFLT